MKKALSILFLNLVPITFIIGSIILNLNDKKGWVFFAICGAIFALVPTDSEKSEKE